MCSLFKEKENISLQSTALKHVTLSKMKHQQDGKGFCFFFFFKDFISKFHYTYRFLFFMSYFTLFFTIWEQCISVQFHD